MKPSVFRAYDEVDVQYGDNTGRWRWQPVAPHSSRPGRGCGCEGGTECSECTGVTGGTGGNECTGGPGVTGVTGDNDEHVILKLNLDGQQQRVSPYSKSQTTPAFCMLGDAEDGNKDVCMAYDASSALRVVNLLRDFEAKNKSGEWPSSTSVHCYWCCHEFGDAPYGLPAKLVDGTYHVLGCFCSLECAMAYNFDSRSSVGEIWERNSLLHALAADLGIDRVVKPAPPRLALCMFGGHLKIEEFRRFTTTTERVVHVNFPPMQTLRLQVEELNAREAAQSSRASRETTSSMAARYIPVDNERIKQIKDKMTLRRTKPVNTNKNTLDRTMNLTFGK
ncbi:hypothetical protein FOA52_004137 [Chlamydomonas sp. UWO 241]|nr:hypothetical protein FOA52_004137 [Chlamydomonas sp. UWO 241]